MTRLEDTLRVITIGWAVIVNALFWGGVLWYHGVPPLPPTLGYLWAFSFGLAMPGLVLELDRSAKWWVNRLTATPVER